MGLNKTMQSCDKLSNISRNVLHLLNQSRQRFVRELHIVDYLN